MLYELRYLPESTSSTPQQLLHFITFTAACPDDHGTNKKRTAVSPGRDSIALE